MNIPYKWITEEYYKSTNKDAINVSLKLNNQANCVSDCRFFKLLVYFPIVATGLRRNSVFHPELLYPNPFPSILVSK